MVIRLYQKSEIQFKLLTFENKILNIHVVTSELYNQFRLKKYQKLFNIFKDNLNCFLFKI